MVSKTKLNWNPSMSRIQPKTYTQGELFHLYQESNLFLYGSPGTGKTFLSLYLAIKDVLDHRTPYQKVVIVRSAVPSRDVGFLPGSLEEKIAEYEAPYRCMCDELFSNMENAYDALKLSGYIEFTTTSFLRGTTFNNCVLIVDEAQNMRESELHTVITRVGEDCKVIFTGDTGQIDLNRKDDKSGFEFFLTILAKMSSFEGVRFLKEDIVRSGLVKEYITIREEMGLI